MKSTPMFWDVKAILDWLALGRTIQQLKFVHNIQDGSFGWSSRQELLNSVVKLHPTECQEGVNCFKLIDPAMIGNGQGADTYLVKAIRDTDGVAGRGQMPKNGNEDGQYATALQIETIITWIDAGCPE